MSASLIGRLGTDPCIAPSITQVRASCFWDLQTANPGQNQREECEPQGSRHVFAKRNHAGDRHTDPPGRLFNATESITKLITVAASPIALGQATPVWGCQNGLIPLSAPNQQ